MKQQRWLAAAITAVVGLSLVGCSSNTDARPTPSSSPPAAASSTTAPVSTPSSTPAGSSSVNNPEATLAPPPAAAACPSDNAGLQAHISAWGTVKREEKYTGPSVPPVPQLMALRPGTHAGCDRLTFDFATAVPAFTVQYETTLIQDGSGRTLTIPGSHYLVIRLIPAQGHNDAGQPSPGLEREAVHRQYPRLIAYQLTGDYEATVTVALGLKGRANFRVGTWQNHLFIDVQH